MGGVGGSFLHQLLPIRFLMTMFHCALTLLIFYTKDIHINTFVVTLLTEEQPDAQTWASVTITSVLLASIICFLVEFVGLFSGISIFYPGLQVLNIAFHSLGTVMTFWFLSEGWQYSALTFIFLAFTFCPAVIEGLLISYHIIFQLKVFQRSVSFIESTISK